MTDDFGNEIPQQSLERENEVLRTLTWGTAMRSADWLLMALSHVAAAVMGCAAALLWLPPDVPSLMLGMGVGALTVLIGVLAVGLIRITGGRG